MQMMEPMLRPLLLPLLPPLPPPGVGFLAHTLGSARDINCKKHIQYNRHGAQNLYNIDYCVELIQITWCTDNEITIAV